MRHRNPTALWSVLLGLAAVAPLATEVRGEIYAKRATWQETMLATRANLAARPKSAPVELSPWYTTGPLKVAGFSEVMFPEKGIDLQAKGPDGRPLWQQNPGLIDGAVQDLPSSGASDSTYLYRTLTAKQAMKLPAGFSSDDGLEVWLNGKKLISANVARTASPNADRAELDLKPGENQLLLKIFNINGGHGFYFSSGLEQDAALPALWKQIEQDFPLWAGWMQRHLPGNRHYQWFTNPDGVEVDKQMIAAALGELGGDGKPLQGDFEKLVAANPAPNDPQWLDLYERVCRFQNRVAELKQINTEALRRAIEDLAKSFPGKYHGDAYLERLAGMEKQITDMELALAGGNRELLAQVPELIDRFRALQQEALLANPLLDFDKLLLVRRSAKAPNLGLPQNWQGNCALSKNGYDDQIAVLSPVRPGGQLTTLYKPEKDVFVGDVDLNFDAEKMLFSMPGSNNRWQIWEVGADGRGLRQVTTGPIADVDNYDACYLPDGRIIFGSTACYQGVPCVGGGNTVANLFLMDAAGQNVRQLCFDQDHDWCPVVMNNGRVLYARWEYSDSPHYFTRLLFQMNPDGTNQAEYYASNSLWPNSTFYARPIPGHPTKVVGVISGHHGVARMGELVIFDPAEGRREAQGVVQRIPGYAQTVNPIIADQLVNESWPKFLHPYPLSEKHFLVASQPTRDSLWGIYLVDVFDNMVLLKEEPGYVMFEPVPLRKTVKPPVVPDRVVPGRRDAVVYLSDVYSGPGLVDVPRGTVKNLRLYEFHFAYPQMGGHINIGIDGPWDARRILGTVPVEADGSASFRVPANTPIAVQPLDEKGRALQIMRSWLTAMPGEVVSCVGCHDSQNTTPASRQAMAFQRVPSEIKPWYGPARGFGFTREVQPVLDRYCVGCHGPDKTDRPVLTIEATSPFRTFTSSYVALHPFVRRPGPESDYHLQKPLEFHAGTSQLVQMLEKGHYGVKLDAEAWDRLVTWIDLNVPDRGTWHEERRIANQFDQRRAEMRKLYANIDVQPETILETEKKPIEFVKPAEVPPRQPANLQCAGWPFPADEAQRRQGAAGQATMKFELAPEVSLELALIPAGQFVMGDNQGDPQAGADEYPPAVVAVEKPFYLGVCEVSNAEFAQFDPAHDSGYISVLNKDQSSRGEIASRPTQPVIRVTWNEAMAFCNWLSQRTGRKFTLPTEAQWEYACRAGTATPLSFGGCETDFGALANLADQRVLNLCRGDSPRWIPSVATVNDGAVVSDNVGRYPGNAWGLKDMHGNVAEWTRTAYRPYPYDPHDGRDDPAAAGTKSVRGGSWYDRPKRARSAYRENYQPWQHVYNVGFRVVMEME